jgi:hypothetical protein
MKSTSILINTARGPIVGTVRRFAAEGVTRVLTGQPPLSRVNAGDLVEARWSRSPGA